MPSEWFSNKCFRVTSHASMRTWEQFDLYLQRFFTLVLLWVTVRDAQVRYSVMQENEERQKSFDHSQ